MLAEDTDSWIRDRSLLLTEQSSRWPELHLFIGFLVHQSHRGEAWECSEHSGCVSQQRNPEFNKTLVL